MRIDVHACVVPRSHCEPVESSFTGYETHGGNTLCASKLLTFRSDLDVWVPVVGQYFVAHFVPFTTRD